MNKKYQVIILSLFALFTWQCGSGSQNRTTPKLNVAHSNTKNFKGDLKENFYDFMKKFSSDKDFQLERIKFPIKGIITSNEQGDDKLGTLDIYKADWVHLDLSYDSTYVTRQIDAYHQDVFFGDTPYIATVEQHGINNGIYSKYVFEYKNDKWYLVSLREADF